MSKTAIFWIRDGVLVDRMPVNAAAFAVASLSYSLTDGTELPSVASLIDFAFAVSGISCAEKMHRFNAEKQKLVEDVEAAASYYNQLSSNAGARCNYFPGASELLRKTHDAGVLNFITSAVDQSVLDDWAASEQGRCIALNLTEILGARGGDFLKGRAHFAYVREKYGVQKIIYVADAVSELATGAKLAEEFNITPVGFAPEITVENVREAHRVVLVEHAKLTPPKSCPLHKLSLDHGALKVPIVDETVGAMKKFSPLVVSSGPETIMQALSACLPD